MRRMSFTDSRGNRGREGGKKRERELMAAGSGRSIAHRAGGGQRPPLDASCKTRSTRPPESQRLIFLLPLDGL